MLKLKEVRKTKKDVSFRIVSQDCFGKAFYSGGTGFAPLGTNLPMLRSLDLQLAAPCYISEPLPALFVFGSKRAMDVYGANLLVCPVDEWEPLNKTVNLYNEFCENQTKTQEIKVVKPPGYKTPTIGGYTPTGAGYYQGRGGVQGTLLDLPKLNELLDIAIGAEEPPAEPVVALELVKDPPTAAETEPPVVEAEETKPEVTKAAKTPEEPASQ
jgi:hypothetical protein